MTKSQATKAWPHIELQGKLEDIARSVVGDGQRPNLYVVTDGGVVVGVTRDYEAARIQYSKLAIRNPMTECALEDRLKGVIASVEPENDDIGSPLVHIGTV